MRLRCHWDFNPGTYSAGVVLQPVMPSRAPTEHALLALWLPVVRMYASQVTKTFLYTVLQDVGENSLDLSVCLYVHLDDVIWKTYKNNIYGFNAIRLYSVFYNYK